MKILEDMSFDQIKISMKSFEVDVTINAYKELAQLVMYPFHIGITEAGPPSTGIIRSSVGLGSLLWDGYGDTMRVSLTTDPVEEVRVANEILKVLGLKTVGPRWFRARPAVAARSTSTGLADAVEDVMKGIKQPMKVAVMGAWSMAPAKPWTPTWASPAARAAR